MSHVRYGVTLRTFPCSDRQPGHPSSLSVSIMVDQPTNRPIVGLDTLIVNERVSVVHMNIHNLRPPSPSMCLAHTSSDVIICVTKRYCADDAIGCSLLNFINYKSGYARANVVRRVKRSHGLDPRAARCGLTGGRVGGAIRSSHS